jgi:Ca2+-binding RTX toxin-like protein
MATNQIEKYLTEADNSVSVWVKTLQSFGLANQLGAVYTTASASGTQVLDTLHAQNPKLDIEYKVKTGSGVWGGILNVASATQQDDGTTNYVVVFAEGVAGTFIGDSVAAAAAKAIASVTGAASATSISLVAAEVVIAVGVGAITTTAISKGFSYMTAEVIETYDSDFGYTLTTEWSLQDMLDEGIAHTVFKHVNDDLNLKAIYERGESFKLETGNGEEFFTYHAGKNKVAYESTFTNATKISNNGKDAIAAIASFFDKKAFTLQTTTGTYNVHSLYDLSAQEIATLAKTNIYMYDALINLPNNGGYLQPYVIENDPTRTVDQNPPVNAYSDTFYLKRAEFLKSYGTGEGSGNFYDVNMNKTYDIGYTHSFVNFGDFKPATFQEPYSQTHLFGSIVGDKHDTIYGVSLHSNDHIEGLDGNDTIYAGGGTDTVYGDSGDDKIHGGFGSDTLYGGHDNDTIQGDSGNDTIYGGLGSDTIDGGDHNDTIYGGLGNDTIKGGDGDDTIYTNVDIFNGGELETEETENSVHGGEGDDKIYGTNGKDYLYGEADDDYLSGGRNIDLLNGGSGNDTLDGGEGNDFLFGGEGHDTYHVTLGDTIIDSDKQGSIYLNNQLLSSTKKELRVGSDIYSDGVYTYSIEGNNLIIRNNSIDIANDDVLEFGHDTVSEAITIENWQEESGLGITLEKKEPVDVQVFVGDATGREGENLVFNIELNTELEEDLSFDVKVEYTGDAWYGDVDEVRGTVTILAGEKQGTFSVPTKSDQKIENSEQFRLTPVGEYSYDGNDIKTLSMNSGVGLITDGTSLTNSRYQNTYYVGSVSCESPENWMGEEGCPGGQCYSAMVSEFDRGYSSGFGISTTPVYFEKTATWISYSLITYQYSNMISERYVTLDWTHRGTAGDYGIENWVFYDYSLDDFSMLSARGGHMSATGDQTSWSYKRDDEISENIPTNFSFNNSQKFEMFRNLLPQENSEDSTVRLPFEESINQMNKNFGLGTQTNDSMQGTRADETLRANAGDDIVNAGAGDDTVYGGQGSDSLSGGTGSDFLDGGEGDDLYIFNRNDGHDTLIESLGNDTLVFGEGIEQTDLIFVDKGEDLHIKVKNSVDEPTDIVTIKNWSQDSYRIENIRFSDGTTVDLALLKQQLNYAPELQNSEEHIILEDVLEISGQIVAYDLNEDTLTYTVASGSLYGQFSIDQATGDWHYFNETFVGEESVILQVDDGNGGSVKKVLTFETSITEPTITSPVQYTFDEDNTLNSSITVSNPSNSALVYEIVSVSKNGSSTLDEDGTLVYTPNSNYNGPDSITIKVINSYGLSTMQTIDLTVNAVNDAPEVTESQTTYQLSFINSIEGDIGAIDIDSEQLSYDVTSVPQYGTLTIKEDGTFSYETDGTFSGEDSAIIVIDDGEGGSVSKTLIFELDFGVLGTEEDDLLDQKNDKNDVVYAKGGDDEIHTGAGDDIVYGGEGDDIIYGGRGNDTYIFNRGDGEDTIYDIQDQNIVQFGETITEDDIAFVRTAMDELTVYVKDDNNDFRTTSDKIVFDDWFEKNNPENDVFRLADGTEIDVEYSFIVTESYDYVHLNGENNHTVDLLGGNDSAVVNNSEYIFIRGGEGNDTFYVEGGNNNIFDGEEGNDTFFLDSLNNSTVIGGKGDDSIRLKHSDGNHTLSSGEGDDDINISRSTGDYSVSTGDNNDRVNIYRHDGLLNIASGEGDDHLVVNSNNINFIDTGKGNDNVVIDSNGYLNTGEGNDNIKVTTSGYSLNLTVGISHNGYLEIVENISKLDTQNQIEITGGGWK